MTNYLTLDDALYVVERFGFRPRDSGLLASALARPATVVGGAEVYPARSMKAAALLQLVVRNHALIDGNKRAGWTLMVLFLWINGYTHTMGADEAFALVLGVADGTRDLETVAAAIEEKCAPRDSRTGGQPSRRAYTSR